MVKYFFFLCCTIGLAQCLGSPENNDNRWIHNSMDVSDLRRIFQVESPQQVPEYDLVHVRVISKREAPSPSLSPKQSTFSSNSSSPSSSIPSTTTKTSKYSEDSKRIHLQVFGKDYDLHLHPNSDFSERIKDMKVFIAETNPNGKLSYHEEPIQEQPELGKPYHDHLNMAAVLVSHDPEGRLQMDGTLGNSLVIKPLNAHKNAHVVYKKEFNYIDSDYLELEPGLNLYSLNASQARSSYSLPYNSASSMNTSNQYHANQPNATNYGDENNNNDNNKHHRSKRQAPDTVWPEVLLVVDYDSYILHGANSRDVKRYFISFWNGVDLRYKLLSHPTIRVSLAGMIVAKDRDATPYLERNRLRPPNADAVDAAGALTDMGKYLYREDRLPTYDLAVVITKLDMCRRRYEGGRCNRGTAGFAYVGGACVVNKRLEKVNSVAIIEDSGGFSGIIVAAHEVGHLLGCVHDGSPPPSYLGGPGATRCPWEDGFIMSDLRHTERGFRWSSCSVEQFKHFLNGETATCLYNYPHENQLLPRVLPGTMLTLDEQCKRDRGTNACFKDARVCAQLFCFDSASGYCVSYRPAAEGSPCGDGQVCRNGKCQAELENIIPDYTHVTQTISRSPNSRSNENGNNDNSVPAISRRSSAARPKSRSSSIRPNLKSSPGDSLSSVSSDCQDNVEKIGGSMSCAQFLEKYSYRYCNHNYVKRHCCASHALLCSSE